MLLSFEVPTSNLRDFEEDLDYGFALAHQCIKDKHYRDFFKRFKKFTILDNGAFELGKPMEPDPLLGIAEDLGCQEIVAPDKMGNKEETLRLTNNFFNVLEKSKLRKHFRVMCVPHGKTFKDWLECFLELRQYNPNTYGISYIQPFTCTPWTGTGGNETYDRESIRWDLARLLDTMIPTNKRIHLLGLSTPELLSAYRIPGHKIRSVDTSLPVVLGMEGKRFEQYSLSFLEKPKTKLDFSKKLTAKQIAAIKFNIQFLKKLARKKIW